MPGIALFFEYLYLDCPSAARDARTLKLRSTRVPTRRLLLSIHITMRSYGGVRQPSDLYHLVQPQS